MLIVISVWDTIENDRTKYTKECLDSFLDTVDLDKHRLFISDNGSCQETHQVYHSFLSKANYNQNITFSFNGSNLGTARAVNKGIKTRQQMEHVCKSDNDVAWHSSGWADQLEYVFRDYPDVGICGLKRDDIWQTLDHENPEYRTHMDGRIEICNDIMGTCTAINYKLVDAIGGFLQPSEYAFDDCIYSIRSIVAGFRNAFLPHIKITHLDEGNSGYTDWKKREAGLYLNEVSNLIKMYKTGQLSPYYDMEEDI